MTVEKQSENERSVRERAARLGEEVRGAGRRFWLAGLGAIDTIDQQGRGLLSDLIERGRRREDSERPALEARWRRASERVDGFRRKVETGVEKRVSDTLERFGLPDRREVRNLIDRIERLTRKVEGLTARS